VVVHEVSATSLTALTPHATPTKRSSSSVAMLAVVRCILISDSLRPIVVR
jgi:hypothetical protein